MGLRPILRPNETLEMRGPWIGVLYATFDLKDPHTPEALRAYSVSVAEENPKLSQELMTRALELQP